LNLSGQSASTSVIRVQNSYHRIKKKSTDNTTIAGINYKE